jgi:hypothetical protein
MRRTSNNLCSEPQLICSRLMTDFQACCIFLVANLWSSSIHPFAIGGHMLAILRRWFIGQCFSKAAFLFCCPAVSTPALLQLCFYSLGLLCLFTNIKAVLVSGIIKQSNEDRKNASLPIYKYTEQIYHCVSKNKENSHDIQS